MPLKLIFILLCFVEIYAEFWCTEETLLNLIHCLLSTSISYDPLSEYCRARALGSASAPGALKLGAPALPPLRRKIGSASAPGAPKK